MTTIVCIGTGPSLTLRQVKTAAARGFTLYTCNNGIFIAPEAELLYATNLHWWEHYYDQVEWLPCEKWTNNREAARKYDLNCIDSKLEVGLSEDPNIIHHGHGSGYSLVSMAYRNGATRIVLLGYDLKYSADYDAANRQPGSTPRHFFGEYPHAMQHWPSRMVHDGVHTELLRLYQSIADQGVVEVINCTPGSALDCFPRRSIDEI